MHTKYAECTTEDFVRILKDLLYDKTIVQIFNIPGIYEILSEHFNNDVLDIWEDEQNARGLLQEA